MDPKGTEETAFSPSSPSVHLAALSSADLSQLVKMSPGTTICLQLLQRRKRHLCAVICIGVDQHYLNRCGSLQELISSAASSKRSFNAPLFLQTFYRLTLFYL